MSSINTRDLIGDQNTLDKLVEETLEELYEDGIKRIANYGLYMNSGLKYIEMPNLSDTVQGSSAFCGCQNLLGASLPTISGFANNMFASCKNLISIYAPVAKTGASTVFMRCSSLQSVYFPEMYSISTGTFAYCVSLSSVILSDTIKSIPAQAFNNCCDLKSFNFQNIISIGASAFIGCETIPYINAPLISTVLTSTFAYCMRLSSVSIPNVSIIYSSAFYNCTALTTISFPSVKSIYSYAFYNTFIDRLILPSSLSYMADVITNMAAEVDICTNVNIPVSAFTNNNNLSAVILRGQSLCNLSSTNAFLGTAISSSYGYIYVQDALVDTYKSATNWATFANQIVSLDEYPKDIPTTDTISDSWSDIFAAEENGTYITKYSIGDTKTVDIGKFMVKMQIVAMDTDELADNSGNAKITWISVGAPFRSPLYVNQRGAGWDSIVIRSTLMTLIYNNMDSIVKSGVKMVKKTFYEYKRDSTYVAEDYIWIPSYREIIGGRENEGCSYVTFFDTVNKRMKRSGCQAVGSITAWWLRSNSLGASESFSVVATSGGVNTSGGINTYSIVFGFCT